MVSFFFVQLWKPICYYKDSPSLPYKNIKFRVVPHIPALSVISNLFTSSFTSTNNAFRCLFFG